MVTRLSLSASHDRAGVATTVVLVLAMFLASWCSSAVAQDVRDDDARAKTVLAAIRRHGEATKSFIFEWKDTPGAVSDEVTAQVNRLRDKALKSDDPGRREEATTAARIMIQDQQPAAYRLVVDGARMRFEQSGFETSMTEPLIPVPQEIVKTFDGKLGKSLTAKSAGNYPRGRVAKTNETHGLDFVGSLPIVIALRGAEWLDRLTPDRATVSDGDLDNEAMVILTLSANNGRRTYTIWCDPAKDYHVRRIEYAPNPALRSRYDISYSQQESGLWIPTRWHRRMAGPDGTTRLQKTSEVTHYSIGREVSAKEFDLSFPPRTWVKDAVNDRSYILLEDGTQRVVTPAEQEAGLPYEEILRRPGPKVPLY
jgi:hypothetical protein